jgi:NAD+ kinase
MTVSRAALIARSQLPAALDALTEAAGWLAARGIDVIVDAASARDAGLADRYRVLPKDQLAAHADVVITLGGDGTLLDAAGTAARAGATTPVMGINLGRLGFLTEASRAGMIDALAALVGGRARIESRAMLAGRVRRRGAVELERLALNDIVVTRGALARMIEVSVAVDGQSVCEVKADGLIVATPTGSTAYNLSAGGPIVHPAVDAFVVTPIAPHTLTNRPLVLPATVGIVLSPMLDPQSEIVVTFDGQAAVRLEAGDTIEIRRAAYQVRLVHTSDRTHFDMLREKLQWGKS